ncbi:esterase [Pollutimonas nitritireducens]|uniref:Esterase n=1 Tax=Pollutimonas nitritireducens TaxID=2045209 RepID=A0A2N4UBD9_9BURK|nr:PHB depolymerase family esterase [Pollutimonas nitritireducens]PLC52323.1 esterase [Pollutimonas nitritireducens]
MARKLSSLVFSTIKRMTRLQRQALKMVNAPPLKRARKKTARKASKKVSVPRPAVKPIPAKELSGQGTWQSLIHKTAPSRTELLGRLAYGMYTPPGRTVAGMPLLVMLHGCQQTAYEMASGSRMNHLADSKGFVVIYPQQTRRVQALRCWRWFQPDDGHGWAEADAIADLTSTIVLRYKLDRAKVYVAGMSAGAGMAGLTALRHPTLFAAVAMHSGAVLGDARNPSGGMRTMRHGTSHEPSGLVESLIDHAVRFPGMPALILHGQSDGVVSPRNARQLTQQFVHTNWTLRDPGTVAARYPANATQVHTLAQPTGKVAVLAKGTHREYQRWDYLRNRKPIVRLCLIKDVGHAWSGGDSKHRFNAREGPRASLLMWQFFDMHRGDE